MPTYDYQCQHCGVRDSRVQTIGAYSNSPDVPVCERHGPMLRRLSVVPGLALHNALAGDRHYDGLAATDGSNISTRSRHRQYMKEHDLTMATDYTNTWAKAQKEREALRTGDFQDKHLRETIEREVYTAVAKSE